jgi:hypothetical protein
MPFTKISLFASIVLVASGCVSGPIGASSTTWNGTFRSGASTLHVTLPSHALRFGSGRPLEPINSSLVRSEHH